MKIKAIAVLLAVIILITSVTRFFDVKASAIEPVTATMIVIGLASLGFGWAASQFSQMAGSDISDSYESYKNSRINREDTMCYDFSTGYWSVNEDVVTSSEDKAYYQGVADEFNKQSVYINNVYSTDNPSSHEMFCDIYEKGNSIVAESILSGFIPTLDTTMSGYAEFMKMRGAKLRYNILTGEFGWDVPESYTTVEFIDIDGISIHSPHKITRSDGKAGSKEEGESWGWDVVVSNDGVTWCGTFTNKSGYGIGSYLIYNGTVYYYISTGGDSYSNNVSCFIVPGFERDNYKDSNGKLLKNAAGFNGNFSGLYWGYFLLTKPRSQVDLSFENISEDDFKDGTGADYISLTSDKTHNNIATASDLGILSDNPLLEINSAGNIAKVDGISTDSLNDNINTIARAQELGLISDDPKITTDEAGNITAVDDIDINHLKKLVDSMTSDEGLSFEDFEEYYQKVIQLLEASNTDTNSMKSILNNIRSKEQAIGQDITQINSAVKSIAEAITAEVAIEDEYAPQEDEFSFITVEHTGLEEAQEMVDKLPIVGQTKTLLNNLLDGNNYSSAAPSFSFYWDSDGDGTQEKYTALDLSFLESTLTNTNLEDKNRFQKPMTVREFIQLLIIFVCYVSFFIKIIKKLPSLIGGGDGFNGDIKTEDKKGDKPAEF